MKCIPLIVGAAVLMPCFTNEAEAGRRCARYYTTYYGSCYNPCFSTGYYSPAYSGGYGYTYADGYPGYGYGYSGYYGRPFLRGAVVGGAVTAAAYRHHGYYRNWHGGRGYYRGFYRPHPVYRGAVHRARWHR